MSLGSVSRRQFLRLTGVIAGAAGLTTAISACAPDNPNKSGGSAEGGSGDKAGAENKDGSIKAAISYELGTNGYDPMTTTSALTIAANWHTLEGLTEMDPASGKTYAALAAELPKSEGTEIDVKLRKDAKFHNGDKVTVDDVIYSFERVLDPANKSLYASFIPFIDKVEKKDDDTVTFKLSYPVGVFADRLSAVKVVPKAAVEANPKGFDANPVGTGPWKMTDNGGSSKTVKFERFEDYSGPKPARAKNMEWQIIPDSSTRINSLQSGQTQAIDSVPYLNIDQLKATNTVDSIQGFGLLFAMFNCDPGNPFNDVRNRQAFLYAIDIDKVVATGLSGQASPATSFLQESHPNYHKAEVVYGHDEAKAKELFGQTGLKKLRMLCTDHDWVRKCTPLIQESLTAIGIDVDFTERKSSDVYNTIDGKPEAYDVVIAPGDPSVFGNDPDLLMRWWYGGDTWTDTRMHWKGQDSYKEVQELLDTALKATDATTQQDNWNRTFDAISRNVPLYPLFHRKTPSAWDAKTLIDFEPISLTGLSFVDVGTTLA